MSMPGKEEKRILQAENKSLKAEVERLRKERNAFQSQAGARKRENFLLQAKLDRINEESVEKIASETCENCRAFSSRRLCGVENGSICKEIAKAICKLKE